MRVAPFVDLSSERRAELQRLLRRRTMPVRVDRWPTPSLPLLYRGRAPSFERSVLEGWESTDVR